jgi:pimeloyl-ACP methyl ester carboxylesterase
MYQFGDLRLPGDEGPHPLIVLFHGGFWRSVYTLENINPLCAALVNEGYAVWNLEYRRIGNWGGGWPGTFQDVALAICYLNQLAANYPLNLKNIVLAGHSSGATMVLWAAALLAGQVPNLFPKPELLERHPFPGPGLAIRCLCAEKDTPAEATADGYVIPVHSVGVQGDCRSYAPVLAIESLDHEAATERINRIHGINRVVGLVQSRAPLAEMRVRASGLTAERLERLRRADAAVRRISHESGFDKAVWQFPVVLIPFGTEEAPDSVVLRPVDSVDGMTAQSVPMPPDLLCVIYRTLLEVPGVGCVLYDLTHKPPATIEWE